MRSVLVAGGLFFAGLLLATPVFADEENQKRVWTSSRVSSSDGGSDVQEIDLQAVVKNQEEILKKLDEIMEELKIVKIRATLQR